MADATPVSASRKESSAGTFEQLRDAILSGAIPPGNPLVELSLAQTYGVSRTPIREALTRLEQMGLVARTSRGLVVRERSPEEILDIYEARIVLEAKVAEVAAARRTEFDIARIEAALSAGAAADPTVPAEITAANDRFHQALWVASHNETLTHLLGQLRFQLARYPATTLSRGDRWGQAVAEHEQIAQAVITRDSETAGRLTGEHFTRARNIRMDLWRHGIS